MSGEGAEILLPFRKEQICFHKKEQKIRLLGVGLNIFCEGLRVTCSFTVTYDVIFYDPLQFKFLSHAKVIPVRPRWKVKGISLSQVNLQIYFQWVEGELAFSGLLYKLLVFIVTEDESVSIIVAN